MIIKTLEITELNIDKKSSKSSSNAALKSGKLRFSTVMLLIFVGKFL